MRSRAEELRAWNRKVFAWSYAIAALAIGFVLFVWSPEYTVEAMEDQSAEIHRGESETRPTVPVFVQVLFGPTEILRPDGTLRREPPTRTLETGRVLELPTDCLGPVLLAARDVSGSVRLRIDATGEAAVREVVRTTGSACGDELVTATAGALLYHWLPDEDHPAPVEVIQPVTVVDVAEVL